LAQRSELDPSGVLYSDLSSSVTWADARTAASTLLAGVEDAACVRAGLAPGRFPARCAAMLTAPGRLHVLPDGAVAGALAPLPLRMLPGLSAAQLRTLADLRVFTLGELVAVPTPILSAVCGPKMGALQALARGEDPGICSPVRATYTVEASVPAHAGGEALLLLLDSLAANLAALLAEEGKAAREITLTIGFAHEVVAGRHGGSSLSRKITLSPPATHAAELRSSAHPLFGRILRARRLRPRWLELAASGCCQAAYQALLPDPSFHEGPAPGRSADVPAGTANAICSETAARTWTLPSGALKPHGSASLAPQLEAAVVEIRRRFGPNAIGYGAGPS